ncbi:hypothetical protein [Planctomicrobium sp. SH664]|uniref:hypothetical protein n=1 Tax=Planctomicrobium sp. SH664 TaxID=3448125 RepID=UPI003F5B8D45
MIAIYDRLEGTNTFSLKDFLSSILRHTTLSRSDRIQLIRMGGVGNWIWELESKLDTGEDVDITIDNLLLIASNPDESIEELLCNAGELQFGISDASFLFFQSAEKRIEKKVAADFKQAVFLQDHELS